MTADKTSLRTFLYLPKWMKITFTSLIHINIEKVRGQFILKGNLSTIF